MTFTEESEKDPEELSLWVNDKGKVFIEMQPRGNEDGYAYQCITLGLCDVKKLIEELTRFTEEYELQP